MRSALLAVLTRLLFPLEDEDLGVQHEHFRQRLFELPAEVHALAHRIDPQLGNMRDPLFAMDHEGERPEGVTLAVGTVAGRLAATAVSEGERAGKGVGREIETGDNLPFAPPKTVGGRAGGSGSHSILYVSIHADRFEKQTISSRKPKKMPDRRLHRPGLMPDGEQRRARGVPAELLLRARAAHRGTAAATYHREGTDRLRPQREGDRPPCAVPFRNQWRETQSSRAFPRTRSPSKVRVVETALRGVRIGRSPVPRRSR